MSTSVSVIIPTYNYAHYLSAAVQSVLSQATEGVEIVVVDDGSNDQTPAVVAGLADEVREAGVDFRPLRQPNAGLSIARNTGLEAARGELLLFLDADDLLGADVIARQRNFLQAHPRAHAAVCQTRLFSCLHDDGTPVANGPWRLFLRRLDLHLCHFNVAPPHAFMVRRDALPGTFDPTLRACEDHDMWWRLAASGGYILTNPGPTVFYRRHAQSMSANSAQQFAHDALMHQRIGQALLNGQTHFSLRGSDQHVALAACAAASLHTANRLTPHDLAPADHLSELARACLQRIADTASRTVQPVIPHTPLGYFSACLHRGIEVLARARPYEASGLQTLARRVLPDPALHGTPRPIAGEAVASGTADRKTSGTIPAKDTPDNRRTDALHRLVEERHAALSTPRMPQPPLQP